MSLALQPKSVDVNFSIDHPRTGYLQMHFSEVICLHRFYPVVFDAEQPRRFDLRDPGFTWGDSTILRSLVASLIGDGNTGVLQVVVHTSKTIGVYYDPQKRPPHLFKLDIRGILHDEERHGWPVCIKW
jgi:hypothetical protein